MMAALGRIPKTGDEVPVDGAALRVERMDGRRVDRVRLVAARSKAGSAVGAQ
jgi:CBS domain containing-hemolysin-like protein